MNFCIECGAKLEGCANFCAVCGHYIHEDAELGRLPTAAPSSTTAFCAACGSKVQGRYCTACGQNTVTTDLSKSGISVDQLGGFFKDKGATAVKAVKSADYAQGVAVAGRELRTTAQTIKSRLTPAYLAQLGVFLGVCLGAALVISLIGGGVLASSNEFIKKSLGIKTFSMGMGILGSMFGVPLQLLAGSKSLSVGMAAGLPMLFLVFALFFIWLGEKVRSTVFHASLTFGDIAIFSVAGTLVLNLLLLLGRVKVNPRRLLEGLSSSNQFSQVLSFMEGNIKITIGFSVLEGLLYGLGFFLIFLTLVSGILNPKRSVLDNVKLTAPGYAAVSALKMLGLLSGALLVVGVLTLIIGGEIGASDSLTWLVPVGLCGFGLLTGNGVSIQTLNAFGVKASSMGFGPLGVTAPQAKEVECLGSTVKTGGGSIFLPFTLAITLCGLVVIALCAYKMWYKLGRQELSDALVSSAFFGAILGTFSAIFTNMARVSLLAKAEGESVTSLLQFMTRSSMNLGAMELDSKFLRGGVAFLEKGFLPAFLTTTLLAMGLSMLIWFLTKKGENTLPQAKKAGLIALVVSMVLVVGTGVRLTTAKDTNRGWGYVMNRSSRSCPQQLAVEVIQRVEDGKYGDFGEVIMNMARYL